MSSRSAILLAAVLLAACTGRAWSHYAPETAIVGKYHRAGATCVSLEVTRANNGFEAVITGGGPPADGGSAPADCIIRTRGQLREESLTAVFQAVSTEDFSYSEAQAVAERRRLIIAFAPGTAEVKRADTFGYCGLGSEFLGQYRRVD